MEIREWLKSLDMEQYADAFEENDLEWEDLAELSAEELKEDLGIASLGHRKKFLKALAERDSSLDPEDRIIRENYPYLLAVPYSLVLQETAPFQKMQLLKDLFLNYLKYLGLLTATEYFFSGIRSTEINQLFKEKLFQPHFGHWNHFIRETLGVLEREGHDFLVRELPEYYESVQMDKKAATYTVESQYTDEQGELRLIKKKMTAIDGLINFRNRYIGHGTTLSATESEQVFQTYFPMMKQLLLQMDFAVSYPLFRYRDGKIFQLMGVAPSEADVPLRDSDSDQTVWVGTPRGERLPLLPFMIPPEQYMAEFSKEVQLFVYEQNTSRRILYFSPELSSGEVAGEPVAMLNRILKEKENIDKIPPEEMDKETLLQITGGWNAGVLRELQQEQKVVSGVYQHREENEQELRSFFDSAADLYFLAAEAGSGKTNLLTEICRQLTEEGTPVLLLRGTRMNGTDPTGEIAAALRLKSSEDLGHLAAWEERARLIVLMDGLNEHQDPLNFFSALGDLFPRIPPGRLKAAVSWRINSREDFPPLWEGLEERLYCSPGEGSGSYLARNSGLVKPFNRMELDEAWRGYGKSPQKIYKPQFSLADLELKDRSFTETLTNPLLLRLFLELYNGKGLSKKMKSLNLWPLWFARLEEKSPGTGDFLLTLIERMYETEKPELDLDELYDHPLLKEIIRKLDINSPYRRLLSAGVLSQYFKDGFLVITFTIEASYHYLLSRYLTKNGGGDPGEFLRGELSRKASLRGIREAVGMCLAEGVVRGDLSLLKTFIGGEPGGSDVTAKALAAALSLNDPGELMAELTDLAPAQAAEALMSADFVLERNLQTRIRYEAFKALTERQEKADIPAALKMKSLLYFCRINHEHGRYEDSLAFSLKLAAMGEKNGCPDEFFRALTENRLAVAYRKLMRQVDGGTAAAYGDEALRHGRTAEKILTRLLPPGDPELARIYDTVGKVHEYRLEWDAAIEYGKKRIALLERAFDPWHPSLASAYNNTAIVLREAGRRDESVEYSDRAMDIVARALDPHHIEMAYAHWTLAYTYDKFGEPENGVKEMKETLAVLRKTLPEDHPNIAAALRGLEEFESRCG